MKYLTKLFSLAAIASLVIFMSCGPDEPGDGPEPDAPGKANGELLAGSWSPSSVTLDGATRDEWSEAGFTMSFTVNEDDFTGGNFTASNLPDFPDASLAWPASGTWEFATNSEGEVTSSTVNQIVRSDGVTMDLTVSETSLTLSYTVEEPAGKVDGFAGNWTFTFSAN